VDGGRAAPAASTNTFRKAVGDVKGAAVIKQRRIAASFHVLSPSLSVCVCVCGLKNYKLARFDGRDVCSFFFFFFSKRVLLTFVGEGAPLASFGTPLAPGFATRGGK
jgi:hypothetical protein